MVGDERPVRYVRDITISILKVYKRNNVNIHDIDGIMINFDDRHYQKGAWTQRVANPRDLEETWAACTKVYIFPKRSGFAGKLIGKGGLQIKELTKQLDSEFPELMPWQFEVLRGPKLFEEKISEIEHQISKLKQIIDGTHKTSKNWQELPESQYKQILKDAKEELKKSEIDLSSVKNQEKNFFGDFRKIRSEIK